ncbi:hypothetical protein ACI8AC_17500 [Geodermatophilus sp. SYSU D00758]
MHVERPRCGGTEDLVGSRGVDGVQLARGACGTSFLRDQRLRCATCHGTDLVLRPQVMTQSSRGTRLSVVGWKQTHCCTACHADALRRSERADGPLPADHRPRAVTARPPADAVRTVRGSVGPARARPASSAVHPRLPRWSPG